MADDKKKKKPLDLELKDDKKASVFKSDYITKGITDEDVDPSFSYPKEYEPIIGDELTKVKEQEKIRVEEERKKRETVEWQESNKLKVEEERKKKQKDFELIQERKNREREKRRELLNPKKDKLRVVTENYDAIIAHNKVDEIRLTYEWVKSPDEIHEEEIDNQYIKRLHEVNKLKDMDPESYNYEYQKLVNEIGIKNWLAQGAPRDELYDMVSKEFGEAPYTGLFVSDPGNIKDFEDVRQEVVDFILEDFISGNYQKVVDGEFVDIESPDLEGVKGFEGMEDDINTEFQHLTTWSERVLSWDGHFKFNEAEKQILEEMRKYAIEMRIKNFPDSLLGDQDIFIPWLPTDFLEVGSVGGYVSIEALLENSGKIPLPMGGYINFDFINDTFKMDESDKLYKTYAGWKPGYHMYLNKIRNVERKDGQYSINVDVPVALVYNNPSMARPWLEDSFLNNIAGEGGLSGITSTGSERYWGEKLPLYDIYNTEFPEALNDEYGSIGNKWFVKNGMHQQIFGFNGLNADSDRYALNPESPFNKTKNFYGRGGINMDWNVEWIRNNPKQWRIFVAGLYQEVSKLPEDHEYRQKVINWIKAGTPFSVVNPTPTVSKANQWNVPMYFDEGFLSVGENDIHLMASDDPVEREQVLKKWFGRDWELYSVNNTKFKGIDDVSQFWNASVNQYGLDGVSEEDLDKLDNLAMVMYKATELATLHDKRQLWDLQVKTNTLMRTSPIAEEDIDNLGELKIDLTSTQENINKAQNLPAYDKVFNDKVLDKEFKDWKKALIYPELTYVDANITHLPEEANIFMISMRNGTEGGTETRWHRKLNQMLQNNEIDQNQYNSLVKVGKKIDQQLDDYLSYYMFSKEFHSVHGLGKGTQTSADIFMHMPIADYFNLGNPFARVGRMSDEEYKRWEDGTFFAGWNSQWFLQNASNFVDGFYQAGRPFTAPNAIAELIGVGKLMNTFKTVKYGGLGYFSYHTGTESYAHTSESFKAMAKGDSRKAAHELGISFHNMMLTGLMGKHMLGRFGKFDKKTGEWKSESGLLGEYQRTTFDGFKIDIQKALFDFHREMGMDALTNGLQRLKIFTTSRTMTKNEVARLYNIDVSNVGNLTKHLSEIISGNKDKGYKSPLKMTPNEYSYNVKKMEAFINDMLFGEFKGENFDFKKHSEWWTKEYDQIRELAINEFPQLAENPQLFKLYDWLFSVSSQGANLDVNLNAAHFMFRHFLEYGELPRKKTTGKNLDRWGITEGQVEKLEAFLKYFEGKDGKKGIDFNDAIKFMETEMSLKELNDFSLQVFGKGIDKSKFGVEGTRVYGANIFGPKIGNMYLAFQGIYKFPTDVWMMRGYQIATGNIKYEKGGNLRESPYNYGDTKIIEDAIFAIAEKYKMSPLAVQSAFWVQMKNKYSNLGFDKTGTGYIPGMINRLHSRIDYMMKGEGTDYDFANTMVVSASDRPFLSLLRNESAATKNKRLNNTETLHLAKYGVRVVRDYLNAVTKESMTNNIYSDPFGAGVVLKFVKESQLFTVDKKMSTNDVAVLKKEVGNVGYHLYKRFVFENGGIPADGGAKLFKQWLLTNFEITEKQLKAKKPIPVAELANEVLSLNNDLYKALVSVKGKDWVPTDADIAVSSKKAGTFDNAYYSAMTDHVLKGMYVKGKDSTVTWADAEKMGIGMRGMKRVFDVVVAHDWMKSVPKFNFKSEDFVSLRRLMHISMTSIRDIHKKIADKTATESDRLLLSQLETMLGKTVKAYEFGATETGRSLNILKKTNKEMKELSLQENFSEKDFAVIMKYLADPNVDAYVKSTFWEKAIELNRNFLLFQGGSIINSILGNTMKQIVRFPETALSAGVDYVMVDMGLGDLARRNLYKDATWHKNNMKYFEKKYGMKLDKKYYDNPDMRTAHFRDTYLYGEGWMYGWKTGIKNAYYAITEQYDKFEGFGDVTSHEGLRLSEGAFNKYARIPFTDGKYLKLFGKRLPLGKAIRFGSNMQNALDMAFKEPTSMGEFFIIADRIVVSEMGHKRGSKGHTEIMNRLKSDKDYLMEFAVKHNWGESLYEMSSGTKSKHGWETALSFADGAAGLRWSGKNMTVLDFVMERAREATYQQHLGFAEKYLYELRQGRLKGFQFFAPFIKTGFNIGRTAYEHSPFSPLAPMMMKGWQRGIEQGKWDAFSTRNARWGFGTASWYVFTQAVNNGIFFDDFHGNWSHYSKAERDLLKSDGQMPNSIRFYDPETKRWHNVSYTGKLGLFEPMVNYVLTYQKKGERSADALTTGDWAVTLATTWMDEVLYNSAFEGAINMGKFVDAVLVTDNTNQGSRGFASIVTPYWVNIMQPAFVKQMSYTYGGDNLKLRVDSRDDWQAAIKHEVLKNIDSYGLPVLVKDLMFSTLDNWAPEHGSAFDSYKEWGHTKLLPEITVISTFIDKKSWISESDYAWAYPVLGLKTSQSFLDADSKITNALLDLNLGDLNWGLSNWYDIALEGYHRVYFKNRNSGDWEHLIIDEQGWLEIEGTDTDWYYSPRDDALITTKRSFNRSVADFQAEIPYPVIWLQEYTLGMNFKNRLTELMFAGNGTHIYDYNNRKYVCLLYTSPSPRDRTRSRMPSSA